MSLRYLLDTNILSEPVKPIPNPNVIARINAHQAEIATASVVLHEMVFGIERLAVGRKRTRI